MSQNRTKVIPSKLLVDGTLRKAMYDHWLAGDGLDLSESSPQDILDKLGRNKIPHPTMGMVSPLEVIILNYITMAMQGNMGAMDKIYNELQHGGVQKMAVAHELSPASRQILEIAGLIDSDGNMVLPHQRAAIENAPHEDAQEAHFSMIDG